MKAFNFLESVIIGFFVGVVFSVYILFMNTSGRDVGSILDIISLRDLLNLFPPEYINSIIFNFFYYVLVFIIYTVLLNLIFRVHKKIGIAIAIILLALFAGCIFEQIQSFKKPVPSNDITIEIPIKTDSQDDKKYFGEEAKGDLNQDNKEDVAFLIKRNDGDERGDMYYLSSSLKTNTGFEGLNLLYIGQEITTKGLEIKDGIINLQYSEADSDEILYYKVKVVENKLVQIIEE